MSYRIVAGALLAMTTLTVPLGCMREEASVLPPAIDAKAAGLRAIAMYDTNKDGQIDGAELDKSPALKDLAAKLNLRDQGITADLVANRIQAWQQKRVGLIMTTCRVTLNGQPLGGAEIKFLAEKFLGDKFKIAAGKTDQAGIAMISVPIEGPQDPSGVPLGLYRIVVTKPGLEIPAKYSNEEQSVLGVERFPVREPDEIIKIDMAF
jgi:hypothetical protein